MILYGNKCIYVMTSKNKCKFTYDIQIKCIYFQNTDEKRNKLTRYESINESK